MSKVFRFIHVLLMVISTSVVQASSSSSYLDAERAFTDSEVATASRKRERDDGKENHESEAVEAECDHNVPFEPSSRRARLTPTRRRILASLSASPEAGTPSLTPGPFRSLRSADFGAESVDDSDGRTTATQETVAASASSRTSSLTTSTEDCDRTSSSTPASPPRATDGLSDEDRTLMAHIINFYDFLERVPDHEKRHTSVPEAFQAVKMALGAGGTRVYIYSPAFKSGVDSSRIFSPTFCAQLVTRRTLDYLQQNDLISSDLEAREAVVEAREKEFTRLAEIARAETLAILMRTPRDPDPRVDLTRLDRFRANLPHFTRIISTEDVTPSRVMDGFITHLAPHFDAFIIEDTPVFIALELFCNPRFDFATQIERNLRFMKAGSNPVFTNDEGNLVSAEVHHILEVDGPLVWLPKEYHTPDIHPCFHSRSRVDRVTFGRQRVRLNMELAKLLAPKYGITD